MTTTSRNLAIAFIYLFLILFETGFLASLPSPLSFIPLILAAGVYLIQSRGWWPACWLIVGFGFFLDAFGLAPLPAQTVVYAVAALAAYASSRALFSNRSLYGILGCGLAAWGAQAMVQTLIWVFAGLSSNQPLAWGAFFPWLLWPLAWMMCLLAIFFYAAPKRTRLTMR